jgi:hypothetical protein
MKTLKHLFIGVLTVALFTAYSPVKAGDHRGHGDGSLYGGASDKWNDWKKDNGKQGSGSGSGSSNSGSTNLPINDYAWALAIFGTAIGIKFVTDKIKFAKS